MIRGVGQGSETESGRLRPPMASERGFRQLIVLASFYQHI